MAMENQILEHVVELTKEVGKLGAHVVDIKEIQRSHGAQLDLIESEVKSHGLRLSALPCDGHKRSISDLYRTVGKVQEDTGVHHIEEIKRETARDVRWQTVAKIAGALVGSSAVCAGGYKLMALLIAAVGG